MDEHAVALDEQVVTHAQRQQVLVAVHQPVQHDLRRQRFVLLRRQRQADFEVADVVEDTQLLASVDKVVRVKLFQEAFAVGGSAQQRTLLRDVKLGLCGVNGGHHCFFQLAIFQNATNALIRWRMCVCVCVCVCVCCLSVSPSASPSASPHLLLPCTLSSTIRHSFLSAGSLSAREAYGARDLEERLGLLAIAHEMFSMGDKRYAFQMKATEEQIKLLRLQEELEERTGEECFVDMSLSETIFNCIVMGQHRFAERVRSDFRISDARFWHIKIRALAQSGAWAELEAFSRDRKSPVGYKPFADACIRGDMPGEAAKYVTRISDATVRCRYLGRIGYWSEAADVAAKQRDPELLSYVRNNCRNSAVERKVDEIAARLGFTS
eukprot:PLAT3524.5.p1 GENE.PLAT3524.5~~PLAT3524.5.p1  ORF type:complete len:422 (+),score=114.59 PLAT3524.5:129-1268(+)